MKEMKQSENTSFYVLEKNELENIYGGGVTITYYIDEHGNIKAKAVVN
ncbi:MAG: bacteriocin [Proteiniphilum sp.]|nr:bacteriocin [Proteiniphilum sp.]MEA5127961.1 bacteriocin [Proteiniphilum sp.]